MPLDLCLAAQGERNLFTLASHQTTLIAAPVHSSGQLNNGTVWDESTINSVDYLRRDNSIVTQPLAPGSTIAPPPQDPPVVAPLKAPPAPITAPASGNNDGQSDSGDPDLESYVANKLGTPYVELPEVKQTDHIVDTRILKCIRCHHRGDPMENLDYPDEPPPSDASHFSRQCVELWDRNGNSMGLMWVTYRRFFMWEIPNDCPRKGSHWLGVHYPDEQPVQRLPIIGTQRSIMKPGNAWQWHFGDPEDLDLES
jgi:hypothetical protein